MNVTRRYDDWVTDWRWSASTGHSWRRSTGRHFRTRYQWCTLPWQLPTPRQLPLRDHRCAVVHSWDVAGTGLCQRGWPGWVDVGRWLPATKYFVLLEKSVCLCTYLSTSLKSLPLSPDQLHTFLFGQNYIWCSHHNTLLLVCANINTVHYCTIIICMQRSTMLAECHVMHERFVWELRDRLTRLQICFCAHCGTVDISAHSDTRDWLWQGVCVSGKLVAIKLEAVTAGVWETAAGSGSHRCQSDSRAAATALSSSPVTTGTTS